MKPKIPENKVTAHYHRFLIEINKVRLVMFLLIKNASFNKGLTLCSYLSQRRTNFNVKSHLEMGFKDCQDLFVQATDQNCLRPLAYAVSLRRWFLSNIFNTFKSHFCNFTSIAEFIKDFWGTKIEDYFNTIAAITIIVLVKGICSLKCLLRSCH